MFKCLKTKQKIRINNKIQINSCKYNIFASLLFILFFAIIIFKFYNFMNLQIANMLYTILGVTSLFFTLLKTKLKNHIYYLMFIFVYITSGIVSMLYNSNADVVEMLWPMSFMSIGLLLLNFKINYKMTMFLYYLLIIIIAINYNNYHFYQYLNAISVYVLLFLSIYVIVGRINNINISIFPYIVALYTSMLTLGRHTGGRGGFITFLFLLITYFFQYTKSTKALLKFIIVSIALGLFVMLAYSHINSISFAQKIQDPLINFQKRGFESVRFVIWNDYILKTQESFFNIIFGTNISGTLTLNRYSENLHNSFLMLHAKYGLFMLLLILLLLFRTIKFLIINKQPEILYLVFALFIRMNLDYTNFNSILDVILIYYLFMPSYYKINDYKYL